MKVVGYVKVGYVLERNDIEAPGVQAWHEHSQVVCFWATIDKVGHLKYIHTVLLLFL